MSERISMERLREIVDAIDYGEDTGSTSMRKDLREACRELLSLQELEVARERERVVRLVPLEEENKRLRELLAPLSHCETCNDTGQMSVLASVDSEERETYEDEPCAECEAYPDRAKARAALNPPAAATAPEPTCANCHGGTPGPSGGRQKCAVCDGYKDPRYVTFAATAPEGK